MTVRIYKSWHVFGPLWLTLSRSGWRLSFRSSRATVSRRSDGQRAVSVRVPGAKGWRLRHGG